MNKYKYLYEVETELLKYDIKDHKKLLDQAHEIVDRLEDDNIESVLGSPKLYALELIDQNDMIPLKKQKESSGLFSFFMKKILPYLILMAIGGILIAMSVDYSIIYIAYIALFLLIGRAIFMGKGILETSVFISLLCGLLFLNSREETTTYFLQDTISSFLFIYPTIMIVYNIIKHLKLDSQALKSNCKVVDNVADLEVSFGLQRYTVKDVDIIKIHAFCSRVFIDLTKLDRDIEIFVSSMFSEINLILDDSITIIDNTSITLGTNIFDLDNNKVEKNGYTITINGNVFGGVINTMEA